MDVTTVQELLMERLPARKCSVKDMKCQNALMMSKDETNKLVWQTLQVNIA